MKNQSAHSYWVLLLASVIGPALLFAAVAAWSWNAVSRNVDGKIMRDTAILHEQALRLLQIDEQLLYRIEDRVAAMEWPEIKADEPTLHSFLKSLVSQVGEVNAAFIADADGTPQVSSGFFPLLGRVNPAITAKTIEDRPYFRKLAEGQPIAIGAPHKGAVRGETVIEIAARLTSPGGAFRGVAVLVLSQARLAQGWSSVTEPGDTVSLVDRDGTVFARYPAAPLLRGERPPHFTETSMRMIDSAESGLFDSPPSTVDGVVRRAGFRKLDNFPLYVVYAIAHRNIRRQWYPTVAAFGGLSAAAAAALMLASFAVIRRASREEREQRFSDLLIENSIDGIVAKDSDLRYTVWSRGMERMSGIPAEKVVGRRTEEVFEQSALGPTAAKFWQDALAGRTTVNTDQRYDVPRTGRHGYYDQTLAPFRDTNGQIIGAVAFVHDATDRHEMEAELRQAQKMEAMGQLTGGIAHDFNNILTVIFGNLETLQRHIAGDARSLGFVNAAERAAQRAAILTDRLLAFGRRQPLNRRPLDLNDLVSRMSDLLRRTLGERITIETILAGGVWRVSADANQLENAILNLAINARDAMPDGGTLTIRTSMAVIESGSGYELLPGEYGLVEVADTGTGMSDDVIARAFEPFFTTKEVGKGSGLGLSQVYGFTKQLGGHVVIGSELGRGTRVTLYLPRTAADDAASGNAPRGSDGAERSATPQRGSETILLVEDDEAVRDHVTRLLHELGYCVLVASDSVNALAMLEKAGAVSLLFTDIELPGEMNGIELAGEALARQPHIRILLTTGYAEKAIRRRTDSGRTDEILTKPFTFSSLASKVREVLDRPLYDRR